MTARLAELGAFVQSGATDVAWRLEQLELLRSSLQEEKEAMCAALKSDLCVDEAQATLLQIASMYGEIDAFIDGLQEWSAPQKVDTPAALLPASSYVQAQPKGVVLVLGAWNYPFNVTIGPAACAIAAGNCVVIKPSELAPETAKVMERIFSRLDQRAVHCVLGGAEVAAELVSSSFDHIVYTGGSRVARLILSAAAQNLTPVTLELGGKSPVIICDGINLSEACKRVVAAKFTNTGQTCIAPDYILVERGIRDKVVELMVKAAHDMLGESSHKSSHYGRLVNGQAAERLQACLRESHGGKVLIGGADVPQDTAEGHRYVHPTLVLDPVKDSRLLNDEIFGPILPIVTVESHEEATAYINSKPKPLALYVFAPDKVAEKVLEKTTSGGAIVGDALVHKGNPNLPFGGIGNSGTGRMHGRRGFLELSNERAVMYRPLFMPSPLTLPVNASLAKAAYAYATMRPGKALGKHALKIIAALIPFILMWLSDDVSCEDSSQVEAVISREKLATFQASRHVESGSLRSD
eukprot:CAMPEP_0197631472 /NCGR_PEP_ID=MMETSP1338-20131121/8620_1 /TAXON_ID=43686 ORGANISM="Pelagodinium beii, Strain RCC1491" /NCGR_SAMPLE_ID=MMETSP1338 /ASSEMBLY_ACC=CAM_ASM_000754 /LENGTH=522 /DNA_ID=CAMNT_0043202923 /DNA_START=31 /DNA_END=1597 /DNA_ORIENTATION=-